MTVSDRTARQMVRKTSDLRVHRGTSLWMTRRPYAEENCKQCKRYEERFLQEKVGRLSKPDVPQVKPREKDSQKIQDDFVEDGINWKEKQVEDQNITIIIKALQEKRSRPGWNDIASCGEETKTLWAQWDSLLLIDGILYRVWEDSCCKREILQVVVPTVLRKQVFSFLHEAYALPSQEAETVAKVLVDQFVSRFGAPAQLHSDQCRNFESQVFTEMCKLLGIEMTRTTPLHPQSDGMVKRYNRTLGHQITMFVNDNQKDWDQHISLLLMAYRTATYESTGLINTC